MNNDDFINNLIISIPSSSDLKGRQSVRATFKLSSKAIDTLSIIALHLGIKQKSLFDHLMEDTEALFTVAKNISSQQFKTLKRVQKTFVLSRKTLNSLDTISKSYNAPRDALVEYSIQKLESLIKKEREKHENRKTLLKKLSKHCKDSENLLQEAINLLGKDDPAVGNLQVALNISTNAFLEIEAFIEKGKIIENY